MVAGGGEDAVLIRTVPETESTNADMLALAQAGASEGCWLRAERQTGGRGRQGRVWESPVGNFYGSTLVRLRPGDPPAATLALVAAVALDAAIRVFLPIGGALKWPNDVMIDGAKLSGILLERAGDAVVVGIGVNLAHHPELSDRTATSLAAQGAPVEPAIFADVVAEAFGRWLGRWRGEGLDPIRRRWIEHAHPIGTALTARLPDGEAAEGLFDGLTHDGALILRLANGDRRVIHAGDVFQI